MYGWIDRLDESGHRVIVSTHSCLVLGNVNA